MFLCDMTLQDIFDSLRLNPTPLVFLLLAVPSIVLLMNMWAGQTAEEIYRWRYVYSIMVYTATLPGLFILSLNAYLFLFERQSVWSMNLIVQVLPVLTMCLTLWLVKMKIPFQYLPGLGSLSGMMTLAVGLLGIMWLLDRMRLYAFVQVPFVYLVVGFVGLLLLIRYGWTKLF